MLLLLVRHGMTDHVGKKLSGWSSGVHLSAVGRRQADDLVERLDGVTIDAIYSSPLDRAVQTAEPLSRARNLPVTTAEGIGEVRYGGIEGKSLKVLVKTKMWSRLRAWPSDVRFPNGESLRETQARAVSAIEDIRGRHKPEHTVVAFSHGDWIRLALAHYLGVHIDLYRRILIDPISVSAIRFFEYAPQIEILNDTGSLRRFARPEPQTSKGARRPAAAKGKR